jgi:UDP-3-O-[3-hydroxymyristoyl] N-acetylglucosamine deacetylase
MVFPALPDRQTGLASAVEIHGVGIHTGAASRVSLRPAAPGTGVVFVSCGSRVPAKVRSVVDTRRCMVLGTSGVRIATVEHALSALAGMGVDNAEIEVDGPELPILDGSAAPWVAGIQSAGIATLSEPVATVRLTEPLMMNDGDSWLIATPADRLSVTCVTCYDHTLLGTTIAAFSGAPAEYARDVAPARTYGFEAEVQALLAAGLGRGGTLDNALVIHDDRFSSPLRLPAEWTRHKLLDLIGDLSLVGGRLLAAITAIRPGHRVNARFAAAITEAAQRS